MPQTSTKKRPVFINKRYKEHNLKDLIFQLENYDECYHMRVQKGTNYIFYGDCDYLNITYNEFISMLIKFLKLRYNINRSGSAPPNNE